MNIVLQNTLKFFKVHEAILNVLMKGSVQINNLK